MYLCYAARGDRQRLIGRTVACTGGLIPVTMWQGKPAALTSAVIGRALAGALASLAVADIHTYAARWIVGDGNDISIPGSASGPVEASAIA